MIDIFFKMDDQRRFLMAAARNPDFVCCMCQLMTEQFSVGRNPTNMR